MPQITSEDFQLSSDEEYHEKAHSAGADSVYGSIQESSKDGVEDNCVDGDPYLHFLTDYEKFDWDESRWKGIPNVRKHETKAKKDKKEEQGKLETQFKNGEGGKKG